MARRRREVALKEDIKEVGKEVLGKLLWFLLGKLVRKIVEMLKEKGWVSDLDKFEDEI